MAQDWVSKPLGDLTDFFSGGTPNKSTPSYWGGEMPWVTVKDMKSMRLNGVGYTLTDEGSETVRIAPIGSILILVRGMGLFKDLPVVLCDRPVTFNQDIKALVPKPEMNSEFLAYSLLARKQEILNHVDAAGHGTGRLDTDLLKSIELFVPPLKDQQKISALIRTWDEAIEKTGHIISKKEKRLQHVRSLLINNVEYDRKNISDIATEKSERNRGASIIRVLSVTNKNGFVLPEDQFQRRVASEDVSNYKIVRRGEYAYNPSRINVGSIARLDDYDDGILSPMYIVFALNERQVNSDYFLNWLSSSAARQRIRNAAQGSVRETVGFSDLCSIRIPLPDLKTQNKIVEILHMAQLEISNLRDAVAKLKSQKRGLMQKLLTGEWSVKVDNKKKEAAK